MNSPFLIASIAEETPEALIDFARQAFTEGADLVELRLDALASGFDRLLHALHGIDGRRCIVTCRPTSEGGHWDGTMQDRVSLILAAAGECRSYVDFEFDDWLRSANIRQKIDLAVGHDRTRLILSHHALDRATDPAAKVFGMRAANPLGVAKMVWRPHDIRDNLTAFDLMKEHGRFMVAICLGIEGLPSRVLAGKLGAFGTYCAPATGKETAPGQPTLWEMRERYRWERMTPATLVYGVIGSPVRHSVGPDVFNALFAEHGIPAVYLPFEVPPDATAFREFLESIREWLHFSGASVTMPHKEAAFNFVRPHLDPWAERTRAVNTLLHREGRLMGFNTDAPAFLAALCAALRCQPDDLKCFRAAVLGAGGAARAVVGALRSAGVRVTIYNRALDRANQLAKEFDAEAAPWEERNQSEAEIVVNATSIGMAPHTDEIPMDPHRLSKRSTVVELVYRPRITRFASEAVDRAGHFVSGLQVYANQAAIQYKIWTSKDVPVERFVQLASRFVDETEAAETRADVPPRTTGERAAHGHVVLIGYRGAGKTTVGKLLAQLLDLPFRDTDGMVRQQTGETITEIFETDGELGFRRRERQAVMEACAEGQTVLSVGGGATEDAWNRADLRRTGIVVWLTASAEELFKRMPADPIEERDRPPLTGLDGLQEVRELLVRREMNYRLAADVTVWTEEKTPEQVAAEVADAIKRLASES